ncbi:MAG: YraN family protein [Chloroflexi bacterium]|nr:YraN family protein [Chloroflexota bacterium]
MSGSNQSLGKAGEAAACSYLVAHGWQVVERNYRCPWGEVDIVAQDGDTLVFVEVRTRQSKTFGTPQESVTAAKRQHLVAAAQHYLQERGLNTHWRIDLLAVFAHQGRVSRVLHIPNAVSES